MNGLSLGRVLRFAAVALTGAIILACGGGGGGGTSGTGATLNGRALSIETGTATNPKSKVVVGSANVVTEDDGSFQLDVATGATSATVDTLSSWGTFSFTFPAASGTVNLKDWWVGPNKVSVAGKVVSSVDGLAIEGAAVEFAGRTATTAANGKFTITNVAYSPNTQAYFWGIAGSVTKFGFFTTQFSTQPNSPIAGTVTVSDIVMTPSSDIDPPPTPSNIWGRITPSTSASGATATLKLGGIPVRVYVVGSDAVYRFWVAPGTYSVEVVKGSLSAITSATLTAPDEVIRKDVTLQ